MSEGFCFPARCNCCVCQNIHCMVYHKGHDHAQFNENGIWFKGTFIPFDKPKEPKSD